LAPTPSAPPADVPPRRQRDAGKLCGGLSCASSGESLRLDARELHHLGPLLRFRGDEPAEVGGRAPNHRTAQVGEPCLEPGIGEGGVDLAVELVDDLGRRTGGCAHPPPPPPLPPPPELPPPDPAPARAGPAGFRGAPGTPPPVHAACPP